jgi:hypothetical protein
VDGALRPGDSQGSKDLSSNKKPRARGIFEQPMSKALDVTVSANRIASNHRSLNSYEVRNEVLLEEEKDRICEENGQPAPARRPRGFYVRYDSTGQTRGDKGYTDAQLEQDGGRDAKHRRTLDRNLTKAGQARYDDVDAHHIVARGHRDAYPSRLMLYGWGIGINDADNGVFLPASANAKAPELAKAVGHDEVHRNAGYYVRVERRLAAADQTQQAAGRGALRKMRADMLSGAFPVK